MRNEMKISEFNRSINTFYFPFCSPWFLKYQDGFYHCACDFDLLINHK